MQSSYLAERKQLESLYKRRKVDIVYSQQPIQPLKSYYSPSEQINIVLQNSKHMVDLGEIELFFRPIVKYNYQQNLPTAAQIALLGITPIDSSNCFFTMQSITFNGNQLMANPQTSLLRTRSIWQAYYNNFMSNTEKNKLHGKFGPANYTFGSGAGSQKTAFTEVGIVGPNGVLSGTSYASSNYEGFAYPRAIMSRLHMYNADFNIPASSAQGTYISNEYFAQAATINGDAILNTAQQSINNGSVLGKMGPNSNSVFPLLPLACTPSTTCYKAQQERFQDIRMRFLVTTVTPYSLPIITAQNGAFPTVTASSDANIWSKTYCVAQANVSTTAALQQKMTYGMSIQDQSQNGISRAPTVVPSDTNCTYVQNEQFTQLSCKLRELSCELDQIGLLVMDSTQVIIQLQLNQPVNVLSAYLPVGNLFTPDAISAVANAATLPTLGNIQTYLEGCQLGNKASYIITDVCCRIPYYTYPDESYAIVRELLRQPKPYQSVRQQIDNIPNAGVFTQRLSIGASSIINALVMFLVPNQNLSAPKSCSVGSTPAIVGRTQDTVINLQGCNPMGQGDLRFTYMDSYYIPMSSVYAEVDGRRYESMDIPLSDPALSTYLKTSAGLQTALGKYVDLDLREYLQNRFFYVIPINPNNDTQMMVHDQQIVITLNLDDKPRVQSSELWNESNQSIQNKFSLLTFAITHQALIDCSYIKVL